jgi:hemerythrin superfamily protein
MTRTRRDVIEVLSHDHREVEQMFAELEQLRGSTDDVARRHRRELVDSVTIELVRHSVAEETQVYPRVQEKVSAAEAERAEHEHAEAEETLKRLEGLDPEGPAFDQELTPLMREIREHVAEEEGQLFPHMRTIVSEDELVEMAEKVESVKKFAPTRPFPTRRASGPLSGPSPGCSTG